MDRDLLKLYALWIGVLCIGTALSIIAVAIMAASLIH